MDEDAADEVLAAWLEARKKINSAKLKRGFLKALIIGQHVPGDARAQRANQTVKQRAMSEVRSVMAMRRQNLACAEEVRTGP